MSIESGQSGYWQGDVGSVHGKRESSRTFSNSSGDSGTQFWPAGSMLRPSPRPQEGSITPWMAAHAQTGINAPRTPVHQHPYFDPDGSQIRETFALRLDSSGSQLIETYTPRSSSLSSPPKPITHSPRIQSSQQRYHSSYRGTPQRPMVRAEGRHWIYKQEAKIKILGLHKGKWTKDLYDALSPYGNVIRIEMQPGSRDTNNAWVVFQPPPFISLPSNYNIRIGAGFLRYEVCQPFVNMIPSPINPSKNYCEINILHATALSFGIRVADTSMIAMQTVQPQGHSGIYFMLNLRRKELDIQFPLKVSGKLRKHRFSLPVSLLSHIYKVPDKSTGQTALIIPCDTPPQFFTQRHDGEQLGDDSLVTNFTTKEKVWHHWTTWFRETNIVDRDPARHVESVPLMNQKDSAIIDLGRWTTYQVSFDTATLTGMKFEELSSALADHGIGIKDLDDFDIQPRRAALLWSSLQEEISITHPDLQPVPTGVVFDDIFARQVHLSFPVHYQLEACLSNGYLKEHNVTGEFLTKLAMMESRLAVHILEKVVDKQEVYYNPMDIFNIKIRGDLEKKVPKYCVLQRSVIITPTMMYIASPVMETSNRIIRKYAANSDRFVRVKFSDETTEGTLRNMPNNRAEAVFRRVRHAMVNGIVVAGRYFQFLAFGNSQFREHGAYFYAPTPSKSADEIRASLGQFDHIRTVAKYGARLGQCFSTTRAMGIAVSLQKIPDIERNGYNFTDGVGKLSLFLAQMAAQELGLSSPFEEPPTLFQFRLGGCKGVLALDPTIVRNEVHIRPSQHKFPAEYTGLEIIRSSALATPFFNRQIIMVLSSLGVHDDVFIKKQQEMVNDYETALTDENVAIQKLRKHIDMNQSTLTMAGMVLDGFMKSREPFIMSLLMLWRSHTIKNLKEKARIAIEDGAFVLGCVDETATLKGHKDDPQSRPGATRNEKLATLPEIFLQVDDTTSPGYYRIIEGICVLARNPSLHPGDLRVVRAVNTPALHHHKNVVVLPQTGDRDLASMCSGGDLDGDDYMVLWDSQLLPQTINVPPMDFTPEKPIEIDGPITTQDIGDFLVTYMKNDSLGQIAHAHLAQADTRTTGVNDYICLELAKLHSQAVDYPKSGIPAVMDQALRPAKFPHFMEKKHLHEKKIYKSKKVLGQLYDQVQLVDFQPQWENSFDQRVLKAYKLDESLMQKARDIKITYDEALRRLMAKHGIRTEFEAWSVFVLAHNHESREYKFSEEFGRTVNSLKAHYREICHKSAEMTSVADWAHLGPFIAAMYTVTAQEMEAALREFHAIKIVSGKEVSASTMDQEHMPLISFPWLFASELGKIATSTATSAGKGPDREWEDSCREQNPDRASAVQEGAVATESDSMHYGDVLNEGLGTTLRETKKQEGATTRQSAKVTADEITDDIRSNPSMPLLRDAYQDEEAEPCASIEAYGLKPLITNAADKEPTVTERPRTYSFTPTEDTDMLIDIDLHEQEVAGQTLGRQAFMIAPTSGSEQRQQDIVLEISELSALDMLVSRFGII